MVGDVGKAHDDFLCHSFVFEQPSQVIEHLSVVAGCVFLIDVGVLITRSTSDVYQIQVYVARGLLVFIRAPILAIWAIMKIAGRNWEWTAATAVSVVVVVTGDSREKGRDNQKDILFHTPRI